MGSNEIVTSAENRDLILIVEDDAAFRRLVARSLEIQGFETREAENGLAGKTIFDLNKSKIKMIISDIQMPELDGVGLLKHVRSHAQTSFILMTGFSDVLETQTAFDMGANDFIAKPFSSQALVEVVRRCLNPVEPENKTKQTPEEEEEVRLQYCPVHIDEFISTSKLRTDIYIRISEKKFIKVAHAGDEVSVERLRTYKEKKVDYLYITIGDFDRYVDFSLKLSAAAMSKSIVPKEKKLRLLKHTTEVIVGKCFVAELDPEIVGPAQRMVEDTLAMVTSDQDTFNIFASLKTHSDRVYAHSVAVSIYSCMVAQQHGWTSASTQFRVAMGGLLHDIGKKEIPRAIISKTRLERSAEDTALLESHPTRGRDIVLQLKVLPEDISQIIHQHHETPNGTGYPNGLSGEALHPLARLVGTIDRFVDLVLPLSESTEPLSPRAALERILKTSPEKVDMTFFRRLMAIFNFKETPQSAKSA